MIEFAVDWTNYFWAVEPGGELSGRLVTYFPVGVTPAGYSFHATSTAAHLAGSTTSILPQVPWLISTVDNAYTTAALHTGETIAPLTPTWDLENTTDCWSDNTWSIEILRRTDWKVDQQGVTFVVDVANGDTTPIPYVYASAYNVISVGVTVGTHSRGGTLIEGVGRTKPDIVAPAVWVSDATPIVASCAGLLIDQAKTDARFLMAKDPRVIKALLLAGATKEETPVWSHSSTQPLDAHFGAGQVNIANSYHMLMNGRQPAGNAWLSGLGWDKSTSGSGRYFLEVPAGQTATFSAVLTWHRTITPNANWSVLTPSLPDLDLRLSTADTAFAVGALVAESRSAIDNVEHVYQTNLPAGHYVLEVTGPAGVTYGIAWRSNLSDLAPPAIAVQPVSQTAVAGQEVSLLATATGTGSLFYQWRKDGIPLAGATRPLFLLAAFSAADEGSYDVVVTNTAGGVTSAAARLSLGPGDHRRLVNLSARTQVGTGAGITISGFVVAGAQPRTLLIRGVGPGLGSYGVGEAVPAPGLTVHAGDAVLATNSGWKTGDADRIRAEASRLGAFALPEDGRDCALLTTFAPGIYTVHLGDRNGGSGVGLIEVYDAGTDETQNLVNLSARAFVGRDAAILISGFVVSGSSPATLLIRGIGPALAAYGVPGTLERPMLRVFAGSQPIAANTGWSTATNADAVAAAAARVGAFALPAGSADSALLVTLQPGIYTMQVSGSDNGTGIALAEIYLVPAPVR